MPLVNYCKKCKAEVPVGESCPYCGAKLTASGAQISFGVTRRVVKEWFAWNALLRIALPVWLLVMIVIVACEAAAGGAAGVTALLAQGFSETMPGLLAAVLLLILILLSLQGVENVHVVLDRQGVHVRTYVPQGQSAALYSRFASERTLQRLMEGEERPPLPDLVLVKRVTLPWEEIRRVRIWREGGAILFFRPAFWQVAAVRCSLTELEAAEAFIRKKLRRSKKTRVEPVLPEEKKKKR